MPEDFTLVTDSVPDHSRPALAIRRSAYKGCDLEILTARYMFSYRPNSPWRDISNDAMSDPGNAILGWREAPELLSFS